MKHIFIIIVCFVIAGCLHSCNTEKKADQSLVQSETESEKECFQYIENKDTVSISLEIIENKIKGSLTYNLYEKDRNDGTITGEVKGDTLVLDYLFKSEGVSSLREVVFLKRNNQLIEGFGETTDSGSKVVFNNRSKLNFDSSIVFTATDCENK